jgi:dTDP-glucose 4,6-dehydratase
LKDFSDVNILVTGADGFIASHLCEFLHSKKANVTALLRRNSGGIFKNLNEIKDKINIKWGDTQDLSLLSEITKNTDIIYHLAAQSHVGYSLYNPYETVVNDVISTLNILEVGRKNDVKRIIHAGSSEIYGNPKYVPIDEKHPLQPRSPYAAAKAAAENLLESYYHTYGLPVVESRFFNIYGPKQGLDQVIPKFILQCLNKKEITIYGDGMQTRDYTFVDDAVHAYGLLGIKKGLEGKVINFGTGKEITIKDLAELIIKLTKSKSKLHFSKKLRTGETPRLMCDPKFAKDVLDWSAKINIVSGLEKTIEYFKGKEHLVSNLPYML